MPDFRELTDMHIHSNCSDGTDDWITILKWAENRGLSRISITDHENCEIYKQIEKPERYFSGVIIPGIEMQAYYEGISIELIGYGYDIAKMQKFLKDLYLPFDVINNAQLQRLYEICVSLGMKFEPGVIKNYNKDEYYYAAEYLHTEMRKFAENRELVPDIESWEHGNIFYKRHASNPNSPFYIDECGFIPSAERVINTIHKAGGKVYIPHIYQYEENSEKILNGLVDNYQIDGIECYYPSFSSEQTEYLLGFCQEHNLLVSEGSDYHGRNR